MAKTATKRRRPARRPRLSIRRGVFYRTLADYLDHVETQDALAARLGVSQSLISQVKHGHSCSLAIAKRLSRATGVPMESFGPDVDW